MEVGEDLSFFLVKYLRKSIFCYRTYKGIMPLNLYLARLKGMKKLMGT
jgi:hypothetical protein